MEIRPSLIRFYKDQNRHSLRYPTSHWVEAWINDNNHGNSSKINYGFICFREVPTNKVWTGLWAYGFAHILMTFKFNWKDIEGEDVVEGEFPEDDDAMAVELEPMRETVIQGAIT